MGVALTLEGLGAGRLNAAVQTPPSLLVPEGFPWSILQKHCGNPF